MHVQLFTEKQTTSAEFEKFQIFQMAWKNEEILDYNF